MNSPETDDDALIDRLVDRLKRGEKEALAELFALFRLKLRRMIQVRLDRRLKARADPSDVLQDAYLDANQRLRHFVEHPTMDIYVWLRLVVGQRLVDLHREHLGYQVRDAAREVSMDRASVPHASAELLAANLTGNLTSPSGALRREEFLDQVEKLLNGMPSLDREILVLRHFEELGNADAARVLGISRSAASNRYVRALKRLKKMLATVPGLLDT